MKNDILYVWLQQATGVASRVTRDLLFRFKSIEELYRCDDFSFLGENHAKCVARLSSKDTGSAFEVVKKCASLGVKITGCFESDYPDLLRRIDSPPAAIYSIGEYRDLNKAVCVAVVGTRRMTPYGRETAEKFAYDFAKSGVTVVSGLAKGVDTAAHRGAVMAGGYTVAVLGNPIGEIYPRENEAAFRTLYKRGLVMSEMYPGCPRTRADFPNRNRIISGLSRATVIAEAGEGSGALITARYAIAQGKQLYAVPGAIGAENAGTNDLIKRGCSVATDPYDVIAPLSLEFPETVRVYEPSVTGRLMSYGASNGAVRKSVNAFPEGAAALEPFAPSGTEKMNDGPAVAALKKAGVPMTADELARVTGVGIAELLSQLTVDEIEGKIVKSPGGRYSAV